MVVYGLARAEGVNESTYPIRPIGAGELCQVSICLESIAAG